MSCCRGRTESNQLSNGLQGQREDLTIHASPSYFRYWRQVRQTLCKYSSNAQTPALATWLTVWLLFLPTALQESFPLPPSSSLRNQPHILPKLLFLFHLSLPLALCPAHSQYTLTILSRKHTLLHDNSRSILRVLMKTTFPSSKISYNSPAHWLLHCPRVPPKGHYLFFYCMCARRRSLSGETGSLYIGALIVTYCTNIQCYWLFLLYLHLLHLLHLFNHCARYTWEKKHLCKTHCIWLVCGIDKNNLLCKGEAKKKTNK